MYTWGDNDVDSAKVWSIVYSRNRQVKSTYFIRKLKKDVERFHDYGKPSLCDNLNAGKLQKRRKKMKSLNEWISRQRNTFLACPVIKVY